MLFTIGAITAFVIGTLILIAVIVAIVVMSFAIIIAVETAQALDLFPSDDPAPSEDKDL